MKDGEIESISETDRSSLFKAGRWLHKTQETLGENEPKF